MGPENLERIPHADTESKESIEKGRNNRILIKIIRHGERSPDSLLTDYGRQVTQEKAAAEKDALGKFDVVKAVGSDAGPKGPTGYARSLETADIYADTVKLEEGDGVSEADEKFKKYKTKERSLLELKGSKVSLPFDWNEYYNKHLPENFDQLDDKEKARTSHIAHEACVNKLLTIPEAAVFRRDVASRHAFFVNTYLRLIERLKSGFKVLYPAGGHGGFMEPFLQQVIKVKEKAKKNGRQDLIR